MFQLLLWISKTMDSSKPYKKQIKKSPVVQMTYLINIRRAPLDWV